MKPRPQAVLRLFCFPYAGGGGAVYRTWADKLPSEVEVCPISLPGRGSRLNEPPFTRLSALVEVIDGALGPYYEKPFAFFGHSMGALVGFELAHRLRKERGLEPLHLFVSGRRAPHLPEPRPEMYRLPEPEFIEVLRSLNGTPREVLAHPELMDLMIPTIRADLEVCQTHAYAIHPPLRCPVTAFGGAKDEEASHEDLAAWREHTSASFSLHMYAGDHFFLHPFERDVVQTIARRLQPSLRSLAG